MASAYLWMESEKRSLWAELDSAYDTMDCVHTAARITFPQVYGHLADAAKVDGGGQTSCGNCGWIYTAFRIY